MGTDKPNSFSHLTRLAEDAGGCSFGVASVEAMKKPVECPPPMEELARFPYAVCVGYRLSDAVIESLTEGPTRLYAYHYRVVNRELDSIALRLANEIQRLGFAACPIPSSQVIDWENNLGHASHRWAAYHAGLGWYGRNNLLISPQYGARVRYATVFTDIPLPTGTPLPENCGECRACISICPAGAIAERRGEFNLPKCREQLRVFRNQWNIGHNICGLCIKACPGNRS